MSGTIRKDVQGRVVLRVSSVETWSGVMPDGTEVRGILADGLRIALDSAQIDALRPLFRGGPGEKWTMIGDDEDEEAERTAQ